MDFDFSSSRNSPYPSAPSTPRGFGDYYYTSAPNSPSRLAQFYQEFDGFKSFDDFAFDVSQEVHETSVSADDLFDGGMIKPMNNPLQPPKPRNNNANMDNHFGTTIPERASRGRERNPSRREARSVSPLRVSKYPWEEEKQKQSYTETNQPSSASDLSSSSSGKGSKKWRLKDFFLFRSASEGRASDKDGLKKYISLFRGAESTTSVANGSTSRRRNSTQISAHELHYTANRAAKQELKKKTFLPYKPGFFGRIQFNPAIAMANGFPVYK
ncbi:hypothetical protein Leryth_005346 [Lithospermum erythrorhizon]|nr:hypothetical protein Leryth_005346 [Lithospermum erythrorhizon]